MSVKKMSEVWELHIDHARAWVLMSLADHAEHDGTGVHPSVRLTAWKTGYNERQVQRIMKWLRDTNVLIPIKPHGQHQPTEYRLDFSRLPQKPSFVKSPHFRGDKMSPLESGESLLTTCGQPVDNSTSPEIPGVTFEDPGVTFGASRGDIAVSPDPSYEPSIEPSRGGPPVDNSKKKIKDSEALAAACVKVCAADPQRFAGGPTELIKWQHHGVMALERTESREVAVSVILETLALLEKALKEDKVSGDWRDYAEAIRKRVRSKTLMAESENHKKYEPESVGGIFENVLSQLKK